MTKQNCPCYLAFLGLLQIRDGIGEVVCTNCAKRWWTKDGYINIIPMVKQTEAVMKKIERWWEDLTPLHESSDGQRTDQVFARQIDTQWEYATVTLSDDGEFLGAKILFNGKVKRVKP